MSGPRARIDKSVDRLNREWAARERPLLHVIHDFFDSIDAKCIERSIAELSPDLRKHIEEHCFDNIIAFDSIIEETMAAGDYVDGWIAIRDWARRQPWAEEARAKMEPIMARSRQAAVAAALAEEPSNLGEQGRMLGILRVHLMRAQTDDERAAITKEIEALTARFEKLNAR